MSGLQLICSPETGQGIVGFYRLMFSAGLHFNTTLYAFMTYETYEFLKVCW